ncbi:MAG: hypothetical protein BAJALOKI3v1_370038 [Promethearchaeota archaeon]|nr:MAG: hypothetical protein BAJALOKI3v1_370038 [Candidatus Lokiarchaeota archaeon]
MLLREFGIIVEGIPIICINYHKTGDKTVDFICKSAVISSIMKFAENLIEPIESFESNKYHIFFKKSKIKTKRTEGAQIIAYGVLDRNITLTQKQKNIFIKKLEEILNKFISEYRGLEYSDPSKFEAFVGIIDKIIGSSTKTTEEKISNLFF